jgi:hypothetical protein
MVNVALERVMSTGMVKEALTALGQVRASGARGLPGPGAKIGTTPTAKDGSDPTPTR